MGRWGDGIYDSDSALDYFGSITDQVEREIAYWFSPEHVMSNGYWLAQILAIIEIMLLFEQHDGGSSVYLENPKAVQRWREIFMGVWDESWQHDTQYGSHIYDYDEPEYRNQHRQGIVKMFDRLESIAAYWTAIGKTNEQPALAQLNPDYPLPYFSVKHWIGKDNKQHSGLERFTYKIIESLAKDIIYYLSSEMRAEVKAFDVEEVFVAVDVLAFVCAAYEQSPGINIQIVSNWRTAIIEIESHFLGEQWDETDLLFQNVMAAFDRLQAIVNKFPPDEWWL
jgi:hypothetical protein